ncbi:3-coathanger stack domain-containing protein [Jiulongibacter sp. NS-SX5]|uniref:3-coathanger stack domain-containing protein n=1 Tax=Jiulongibacter sp. NS-SX5 TaxID=3463854 RepID=UPI0040580291
MDDLLIFNKALNQAEVDSLENYGQNSPSIARFESLNTNYILSGGRRYFWQNKLHSFTSGKYITSFNPSYNWFSASFKIYFSKVSNKQVVLKKEYDYSVSNVYSQIESFKFVEYEGSLALLLDYPVQVPYDKIVRFDSSLNIISETQIPNLKATELLIHNDELVLITKSYDENSTVVRFYDDNINQTNFTIISDNLNKVDKNDDELILSNTSGIYRFNNSTHTFLRQGLSSEHVYLTKENVIMWKSNELVLFDFSTSSLLIAPVSSDTLLNHPDSTNFYLLSGSVITKYDRNVNPLSSFSISTQFDEIGFSHNYFITKQRINPTEGTKYRIFDTTGEQLFTETTSYYFIENLNKVLFPLLSENYIVSFGENTKFIDSNWSIHWSKNIGLSNLFVNNDLSLWLLTSGGYRDNLLVKLNNNENLCSYEAINPFTDLYCEPINSINHTLMPSFKGNFHPISYASPPLATLKKNYLDFGISFDWKKDNNIYSHDYFGEFTGNGTYSLIVKQGNCEIESPKKYVSYDSNTPDGPILSSTKDLICTGESVELTTLCQSGSQSYWTDIEYSSYKRMENPSISTVYYSYCQSTSPRLDEIQYGGQVVNQTVCRSQPTNIEIQVINEESQINLTGDIVQDTKIASGSIKSNQRIIGNNLRLTYISIKSIELLPGFETQNQPIFKGEIYLDCPN